MNYLVISDSYRIIDEEISKIIADNSNIVSFDMNNNSIEDLIIEAGYISLIDDQKYIIVRNSSFFTNVKVSEKELKLLESYLDSPNPQTTIIFTSTKNADERKKITKVIKNKYKFLNIPKLKDYELHKKIDQIAASRGYKLSGESIDYIIKSSLSNYDIIYNELEKIFVYYDKEKNIRDEDVKALVSNNIEDNIFKLVNAIIDKNYSLMFKLYNDFKTIKEEPIAVISLLAREYRNMLIIKSNKNESNLLSVLKLQNWQYEKCIKQSYNYSIDDLKNQLKSLYNLDLNIKSGRVDKYTGLELFMLNL